MTLHRCFKLLNASEVAKLLNIPYHLIKELQRCGKIPPPSHPIPNGRSKLYWTEEEINKIQVSITSEVDEFLNSQILPKVRVVKNRYKIPEGYYTQRTAAKHLGVPHCTFQSWLGNKTIKKAERIVPGYIHFLYNLDDVNEIAKIKKDYLDKRTKIII